MKKNFQKITVSNFNQEESQSQGKLSSVTSSTDTPHPCGVEKYELITNYFFLYKHSTLTSIFSSSPDIS